jgi:hypothetical protein
MEKYVLTIILSFFIIILFLLIFYNKKEKEHFSDYLYPIKGLEKICSKENLKPSYMPKACYVNEELNSYANCKCEDKNGNCKICYDTIKKDSKNSSIVYNANDVFS